MSQQITTRIVLDEHRPYFPGELILGKVMLACPSSITPHAIRLIWVGGVTIRPTLQDHESHIYFRHNYAISNDKLKNGKKIGNGVAYRSPVFVENLDTTKPLEFTLEQSVTYSFAFGIRVPSDIPLPSTTEVESSMLGGKIVYTIESCVDFIKDDTASARSHIMVTVLEHMDVRLPELAIPRSEESVCSLWLPHTPLSSPCNYRTAMRVTIPCQASTRGGRAEIVIHVWHSVEYQRLKGVKVSLLRLRQLHFNGSVYAFPDETVLAMRADIDLKQEKDFMQTLRCRLPIRDDLTPSISDSAKLLEISYKLQIQVQLQEGTYQSLDGECKSYMVVELPFLIGTVPLMVGTGRQPTIPPKSPLSSSDNKKISDTYDSDIGSTLSAESNSKQENKPVERMPSRAKLKIGKMFRFPGSKHNKPPKESLTTITTTSDSNNNNNNYPDNESVFSHSQTSSSKNTDQDLQYSTVDDSNTSHSAPSPTITESKLLPSRIQTQQQQQQQVAPFELRNIRQTNTYPYSPDDETTTSPYELKPDEKNDDDDDQYFDTERLVAANKSKADAIASASIISPIDGSRLLPPRMDSLTSAGSLVDKFVKDDLVSDNGDIQQLSKKEETSTDTVTTDKDTANHPPRRIHYHDIFGSSGEEDSDNDDNDNNNKSKGNDASGTNDNSITVDNDDINKPAEKNDDNRRHVHQTDGTPPSSSCNPLPSPPMCQTEYNKLHGSDSDSSDDNSPLGKVSRHARRL